MPRPMAVIQIGQNASMLLAWLASGWIIESGGGWQTAFWALAPLSVLGTAADWMAKNK